MGLGGRLAQLVERFVYTEDVGSSSLSSPTNTELLQSKIRWRQVMQSIAESKITELLQSKIRWRQVMLGIAESYPPNTPGFRIESGFALSSVQIGPPSEARARQTPLSSRSATGPVSRASITTSLTR